MVEMKNSFFFFFFENDADSINSFLFLYHAEHDEWVYTKSEAVDSG